MSEMRITRARLQAMTADEAAALWLVAREEGDATAEARLFEEWLAEHDENRKAWAAATLAWDMFDGGADDDDLQALRQAALEAGPDRPMWRRFAAGSIAAAAAAAALIFGWQQFDSSTSPISGPDAVASADPLRTLGQADFVTRVGQRASADLPDGSTIALDTDSAIDVAFEDGRRWVRLVRGQAYFDVAPDVRRPFSVEARGRIVTAIGTRFSVRSDASEVRVVLVHGKVVIRARDNDQVRFALRPGQEYRSRGGSESVSPAKPGQIEAWRTGYLLFDEDRLADAVAEVNRYSKDRLVVRDPKVANLRITGRFRAGDSARFGRILSEIHPVRLARRSNGEIEIVSRRP